MQRRKANEGSPFGALWKKRLLYRWRKFLRQPHDLRVESGRRHRFEVAKFDFQSSALDPTASWAGESLFDFPPLGLTTRPVYRHWLSNLPK